MGSALSSLVSDLSSTKSTKGCGAAAAIASTSTSEGMRAPSTGASTGWV